MRVALVRALREIGEVVVTCTRDCEGAGDVEEEEGEELRICSTKFYAFHRSIPPDVPDAGSRGEVCHVWYRTFTCLNSGVGLAGSENSIRFFM